MADEKNQNPNVGSQPGQKTDEQKKQNERAGQQRDQGQPGQGQPGQGSGGQSGDRDRASTPQGDRDMERNPSSKPGQPNQ